jgi:hypothetical protein
MFSDAEDICDDRSVVFSDDRSAGWSTDWPAGAASTAGGTPHLPLFLVVRLAAARRPFRPPDTS